MPSKHDSRLLGYLWECRVGIYTTTDNSNITGYSNCMTRGGRGRFDCGRSLFQMYLGKLHITVDQRSTNLNENKMATRFYEKRIELLYYVYGVSTEYLAKIKGLIRHEYVSPHVVGLEKFAGHVPTLNGSDTNDTRHFSRSAVTNKN